MTVTSPRSSSRRFTTCRGCGRRRRIWSSTSDALASRRESRRFGGRLFRRPRRSSAHTDADEGADADAVHRIVLHVADTGTVSDAHTETDTKADADGPTRADRCSD